MTINSENIAQNILNKLSALVGPAIDVTQPFSGQITVTTPGTAVQGPNVPLSNGVYIKANHADTGIMYIWQAAGDGRGGYELVVGDFVVVQVNNLNQLWFDASVGGEKVCWLKG